jgi:hypothetical protein
MKVKISKRQWESVGKKMGWKKASLYPGELEAEDCLINMSRMIEDIRGMDKGKVKNLHLIHDLLSRASDLIAEFKELARE